MALVLVPERSLTQWSQGGNGTETELRLQKRGQGWVQVDQVTTAEEGGRDGSIVPESLSHVESATVTSSVLSSSH